jgi:hypothetical protein
MNVPRSTVFWWLSLSFVLIVLVAGAPLISAFIAGGIANALGCTLNEGGVSPCPFMGTDIGETLVVMFVLGWLAFVTLPFGGMALAVWLVVACVVGFIGWRRRRAAHEAG